MRALRVLLLFSAALAFAQRPPALATAPLFPCLVAYTATSAVPVCPLVSVALTSGEGIQVLPDATNPTAKFQVNPNLIPRFFVGNSSPTQNCWVGRDLFLNTALQQFYHCIASPNVWINFNATIVDDDAACHAWNTSTVYVLTNAPNPAASLMIRANGLVYQAGVDYTLSAATVTWIRPAPTSTDSIVCSYRYWQ